MTISEEKLYLFIAIPKTGTTTVHTYLKNYDQGSRKNFVSIEGRLTPVENHATFKEIEGIMGPRINDFVSFAFIREPYNRLFSHYRYLTRPKEQRFDYPLKAKLLSTFCKIIGFKLWALIYPMDHSYLYLIDKAGKVAVKYVGRTEHLKDDFIEICQKSKIDILGNIDMMVQMRMTTKNDMSFHLEATWFKKLLDKRMAKDLLIYAKVSNGVCTSEELANLL